MKIIHTADLHLSSPLTSNLTGEKIRERKNELFSTFARMAQTAEDLQVEGIIIAGDLFDSEDISYQDSERVVNIIERHGRITFFYLPGNHEKRAFIDRLNTKPKNLIVFGEEWSYYASSEVTVIGRTRLEEGMFDSLVCDRSKNNIVVLHGNPADKSSADSIGLAEVGGKGISYLALGHYHSYRVYNIDGTEAVYCGTPEGRGFDEAGEKGYVIINADKNGVTHRFVPFAKRRLRIIQVSIDGVTRRIELEDRIIEALKNVPRSDLVRIELVGSYEPGVVIDCATLYTLFSGAYYHFELKDSTKLKIHPDSYKLDKSLRGEFIRLVMEDDVLSDEDKAEIITTGIRALSGEAIEFGEVTG